MKMLRSLVVRQMRRLSNQSMIHFLDGNAMPAIGYGCSSKAMMSHKRSGVQERFETKPGEVERGVKAALDTGYRCLDTAQCYENEEEVGAAIAAKVADGTVQRNEIFVTTKESMEGRHQSRMKMLRSLVVRQMRRLSNQSMIHFLDGNAMPAIGYGCSSKAMMSHKRSGVQERFETKPGEVERGVKAALDTGYRCLDTAQCYENEEEVGAAIAAKVADGTVQRNEIFVTTKVFQTFNRRCDVMAAAKASLAKLRLDHVDLLLVHSSCATKRLPNSIWAQTREDGSWIPEDGVGMEDVRKAGLARSIGVSNFNEAQLQTLWDTAELKPQCLQTEQHIYFPQRDLLAFCEEKGIAVTGYATLGSPGRLKHQWSEGAYQVDPGNLMDEPKVLAIAQRTGNTPAQILLRWSLQHGVCVIPKSNDPARIRQNFEVNFELSSEDMESLDNCATRQRLFFNEWDYDHTDYPWKEEWRAERSKVAKE